MRKLVFNCLFIIALCANTFRSVAQDEDDRVNHVIYFCLRDALVEGLESYKKDFNGKSESGSYADVNHKLVKSLNEKYDQLQQAEWIKGKHEQILVKTKDEMEGLIESNKSGFTIDTAKEMSDEVNRFLVTVLEEAYSLNRTGNLGTNPLSDYRFLLGGTWTHRDSGNAKSTATASMFLRTRLYEPRGKITNLRSKKEEWFVDLLVTAHFITNQAFVDTNTSVTNQLVDTGMVNKAVLNTSLGAISSSELSFGLFIAPPFRFSDWGTVGLVPRFYLSSRAQSADVFRRMSWSLRFENRSDLIIRGASAEIGLTSKNTPGASEGKFKWCSKERWLMDLELPLTSKKNRLGIYVQFHGEWPNVDREDQSKANPSIYQFRVGATYDPAKLLGPLFGLAN